MHLYTDIYLFRWTNKPLL